MIINTSASQHLSLWQSLGQYSCQMGEWSLIQDIINIIFIICRYCNNRVVIFDKFGNHLRDIRGEWNVVHSIVLDEEEDMLCVADREGKKVECFNAGLKSPRFLGRSMNIIPNLGRVYAIAGREGRLVAVNGKEFLKSAQVRLYVDLFVHISDYFQGVTIDIDNNNQIVDTWGDTLDNPHDIALDRAGGAVYVAEIGPNRIRKFVKSGF